MSERVTTSDLDQCADALTGTMHSLGLLHPDARFVVGGEYGRSTVDIMGGPYFASGVERLTRGTKRECLNEMRAVTRALSLGRLSLKRW